MSRQKPPEGIFFFGVRSATNTQGEGGGGGGVGRTERNTLAKPSRVRIGEYVDFDFTAADDTRALRFGSRARALRLAAAAAIVQTWRK